MYICIYMCIYIYIYIYTWYYANTSLNILRYTLAGRAIENRSSRNPSVDENSSPCLTASRSERDKRGRHRSATIPHNQRSILGRCGRR